MMGMGFRKTKVSMSFFSQTPNEFIILLNYNLKGFIQYK